jgi:hypothetical protein
MRVTVTWFRVRKLVAGRLAAAVCRVPALRPLMVRRFAADLRRLHDALEGTGLAGRYWVWGGLLLGWARDGAIMPHDCLDADFAVEDGDFHLLAAAVPALAGAGFRSDRCFVSNAGVVTELTFTRRGARFEFFRMFPEGARLRYFMYSIRWRGIAEVEAAVPNQAKVPFSFVGRTWRKPEDHARELRAVYGPWEIPDPSWSYLDQADIIARRSSCHKHFDWPGGAATLPACLVRPGAADTRRGPAARQRDP